MHNMVTEMIAKCRYDRPRSFKFVMSVSIYNINLTSSAAVY